MIQQLLLSLVALSLLFSPWRGPVAKSYSADHFDVDIAVQTDGSLVVTERLTLRFVGGPFTYAYRYLPTTYTDGIDIIGASIDDLPLPEGKNAGQVEIAGLDPVKVTWHFAPTSDSIHTYTLTYRAWGVIRKEADADVLLWQALPDEYEYSIAASTIRVTYPETARLLDAPTVQAGAATVEQGANTVTFDARDLKPNSSLIVKLRFSAGSLIATPPQWQTRRAPGTGGAIMFAIVGSVAAAIATILVVAMINRARYAPARGEPPLTLPPSALAPALAGVLVNNGNVDGWAWVYALGACFDLARRGIIGVEEAVRRSWFQGRDFIFRLKNSRAALAPHEQATLEMFFGEQSGLQSAVSFNKLQRNLYRRLKSFATTLKAECETRGFFDAERRRRRTALLVWGLLLIFLGGAAIVVAALQLDRWGSLPLAIAMATPILGTVLLIVAAMLSPLSEEYQQTASAWKSFARYLKDVVAQRDTLVHREQFEGYLPYATAFGMAESWARYLKKHEDIEVPAWFQALAAEDGGHGAFAAMVAAGSSSGAAAAGAGGAAGGGASGAG